MTWNLFMHSVGCVCLIAMAGCGIWSLYDSLVPNWSRIWPRACGAVIFGDGPASPTASVLPLRTRHTPLPIVEADPQLTRKAS
ncbi:hypothetical protein C8J40_109214 [Sphingomonas sp. PP-CC-3A-396]|nr:hypothetical protein C8J40_109214 [Sphingomonas sp. PP-CC-3A-396]